jgi:hypothetical protein
MEQRGVLCIQAFIPKKIIWKKPGDVNLEIAVRTISLTVGACSNTIPAKHKETARGKNSAGDRSRKGILPQSILCKGARSWLIRPHAAQS